MQRGNQRDSRFKSRDRRHSGRINTMEGYRYQQDVKTLDVGYWYKWMRSWVDLEDGRSTVPDI